MPSLIPAVAVELTGPDADVFPLLFLGLAGLVAVAAGEVGHLTLESKVAFEAVGFQFTRIDGRWADAGGRSFRDWMEHGIDGVFPTHDDWDLHLTSVFPEARVKRTIEIRGADCVPAELAASFVTLFKGLLYCRLARDEAGVLAGEFAAAAPDSSSRRSCSHSARFSSIAQNPNIHSQASMVYV